MSDVSNFIAHHPPAIKVGGRRHSFSAKHRPQTAPQPASAVAPPVEEPVADYPRPAPPGEEVAHVPPPPHNEEETQQRRDKKHELNEQKLMQRKAEMTRPTRDLKTNGKGFGGAGRIAQPMKDLRV
ncbi:hypothetical protein DFH07DRAFT_816892 [Mycena maculata]|uniref:Uncharacterized protein n=1 Tax=Mycena maculata TaxID=230809 RepID=A0AAD7JDE9_9AGAR|nr:hypothetical protein DFH07DRAFT_816892 [Mycena maculata]